MKHTTGLSARPEACTAWAESSHASTPQFPDLSTPLQGVLYRRQTPEKRSHTAKRCTNEKQQHKHRYPLPEHAPPSLSPAHSQTVGGNHVPAAVGTGGYFPSMETLSPATANTCHQHPDTTSFQRVFSVQRKVGYRTHLLLNNLLFQTMYCHHLCFCTLFLYTLFKCLRTLT